MTGDADRLNSETSWKRLLQQRFGIAALRGSQEAIIRHCLEGKHCLVIMPTGGGKSLCYQLPALARYEAARGKTSSSPPPLTIVLSPLIALMKDQVDALRRRGIPATFVNSSLSKQEREERYAQVKHGEHALLYVTPERFRKEEFIACLQHRHIALLAVDEAHCISEWGHDFRPDYTRVREIRELMGNPPTIALTATATPDVQRDIVRQLGLTEAECPLFHQGIERPNLRLRVEEVWGSDEKDRILLEVLSRFGFADQGTSTTPKNLHPKTLQGNGIVYFTLIRTLVAFSERLRRQGLAHLCYHGDLDRHQRRAVQEQFMQHDGELVFATNAFGMGIDKENIRVVLHAELPGSMEAYFQEIGRAGRDGLPSECCLCYDQDDLQTQMEFLFWSNPDADFCQRVYHHLVHDADQVQAFGVDWLRQKLCDRQHHDRRLETVLLLLDRYGAIDYQNELSPFAVTGPLPEALSNASMRQAKLRSDQMKLMALVEYVKAQESHADYIAKYFAAALPPPTDQVS